MFKLIGCEKKLIKNMKHFAFLTKATVEGRYMCGAPPGGGHLAPVLQSHINMATSSTICLQLAGTLVFVYSLMYIYL